VYLNHVKEGGGTYFNRLNLRVKPQIGKALVFFPGFLNKDWDERLEHAAEPAVDEKWVSQTWVCDRHLSPDGGGGDGGDGGGSGGGDPLSAEYDDYGDAALAVDIRDHCQALVHCLCKMKMKAEMEMEIEEMGVEVEDTNANANSSSCFTGCVRYLQKQHHEVWYLIADAVLNE
jgi:hypothetical protein